MTVHDLHDAIGMLDEDLLEQTDRLRAAPRKRVSPVRRYRAATACLALMLGGTFVFWFVSSALRCGSAAPTQFMAKSAPMENAAEAQRSEEDSAAPAESPAERNAAPESAEDSGLAIAAPASGSSGEQGELPQPPTLVIGSVTLTSGNYSWTVRQADGTARTAEACGAHPTDDPENLPMLRGGTQTFTLDWAAAPESVTVRCWQVGQEREQEAVLDGNTLSLQPGDWVYEVCAEFAQGKACYAFRGIWE